MKFKLDENLGSRGRTILMSAGHEVQTVSDQGMSSATDEELIEKCRQEKRGLVSLDLDFANPLRFQPSNYSGIAVLRLPAKASETQLLTVIQTLLGALP